jgi:hypothetical protein
MIDWRTSTSKFSFLSALLTKEAFERLLVDFPSDFVEEAFVNLAWFVMDEEKNLEIMWTIPGFVNTFFRMIFSFRRP